MDYMDLQQGLCLGTIFDASLDFWSMFVSFRTCLHSSAVLLLKLIHSEVGFPRLLFSG